MFISSRDNPRIKRYIKLSANRKSRYQEGLFVIEGARVCRDAFEQWQNGKLNITSCFATHKAVEKYTDYIDPEWFNKYEQFCFISDDVAQKMSDSEYPQGIFVEAEMIKTGFEISDEKTDGKYLILDDLQDPGNVGTLLRTAEAVGVDAVFMCGCCDLYNPKVIRSAMGTVFRMRIIHTKSFSEVIKLLKGNSITVFASVIDENAESIINADFGGKSAMVLGNEGSGLSQNDVMLCDKKVTISMRGNTNSLNVASAGAILLWEMCKGGQKNG